MSNTGNKIYLTLVEKRSDNNLPTGFTKPNIISDPDYIPPIFDLLECPLPTTTTTTINTCTQLEFNLGAYYNIDTIEDGIFYWNLPINMSLITSIQSWSLRVQTSQSCRTVSGFIYSQLDSWDVLLNGVSGSSISTINSDGSSEFGNLFNGSFFFNPLPVLMTSPNPCGGTRKVWQNQTTIILTINYLDSCGNPQVYTSTSYIPQYRITLLSGGGTTSSGGCLLKGSSILLGNNDEKLIENVVSGDMLRGVKLKKEQCHLDTFKDSLFIQVEVEKVDRLLVNDIIIVNNYLYLTESHKHVVLRKETLLVIEGKDIVRGDKMYNFEKMTFEIVHSIEYKSGVFEVYNIEIKGDYKYYFVNNILTHNKTIELQIQ